jgi:hypothetical protein
MAVEAACWFSMAFQTSKLTPRARGRSVIIKMPRAMRIRNANWLLRAVSLVTFVALVVAPVCASLCAGQNCRRADASATDGNCHRASTVPHKAPRAHAILGCSSPELPAVVSARAPLGGSSGASRLSSPDGKFLAAERENSASTALFSGFCFGPPHGLSARFAPVAPSVLRI